MPPSCRSLSLAGARRSRRRSLYIRAKARAVASFAPNQRGGSGRTPLPALHLSGPSFSTPLPYPLQIGPYTNLFLFNFQRRAIHGVFYPDGKPGLDIDPAAWQCALPRKFPAQLRYMHSELTATLANTDKLSWQPRSGPLTQRQVDELYALLEEAGGGGGGGGGGGAPPMDSLMSSAPAHTPSTT